MLRRLRTKTLHIFLFLLVGFPLVAFETRSAAASTATAQQTAVISPNGWGGIGGASASGTHFDVDVAAGPSHVVEVVHGGGEIFRKDGSVAVSSFDPVQLSNTQQCHGIDDLRVLFDTSSQRWFLTSIYDVVDCTNTSNRQHYVDVWVSPTSDPTSPWGCFGLCANYFRQYHAIGPSSQNDITDHPEIAVTSDKVTLTAGKDTGSKKMVVFSKNDLVNMIDNAVPKDLTSSIPPNTCAGQPYPVRSLGSVAIQYMVCMGASYTDAAGIGVNDFFLFNISGNVGSLSVSPATWIATIRQPPPGLNSVAAITTPTGTRVIVADPIFQAHISAVYSSGQLWFSTTGGCLLAGNLRDCIRLTQVNVNNSPSICPTFICQDFPFNQTGLDVFFPILSIDAQGDLAVAFGYSSSTVYPSLGITGQAAGDTPGNLALWRTLKQGSSSGFDTSDFSRYADFFGAALDPVDTTLVWVTGGYWPGASSWSTWIASMRVIGLSVMISPSSLTIPPGASGTSTITLQSRAAFSGAVNMSSTVLPNWGYVAASYNPSTVQLGLHGTGSSIVNISTASSMISGPYTVYVTAGIYSPGSTYAILAVVVPLTVTVPYFSVTAGPKTLTFTEGTPSSSTASITVKSTLDFYDATVTLSVSSPLAASLSSTSVFLPHGGSVSVTLTVSTDSSTPQGNYFITVTATTGPYTASDTITIIVYPPPCPPRGCPQSPTP